MTDARDDLALATEFPAATREQWLALVDKALKGAPFEKKLVGKTYDGLRIDPLYPRRSDATPLAARAPAAPWQIMARVDHPDPATANKLALDDLEGGATGLVLTSPGATGSYGYGADLSAGGLERILDGVFLDGIAIEFDITPQAKDAPANLAALLAKRGLAPDKADVRFGFDPFTVMATGGGTAYPWKAIVPIFGQIIKEFAAQGFKGPFVCG